MRRKLAGNHNRCRISVYEGGLTRRLGWVSGAVWVENNRGGAKHNNGYARPLTSDIPNSAIGLFHIVATPNDNDSIPSHNVFMRPYTVLRPPVQYALSKLEN